MSRSYSTRYWEAKRNQERRDTPEAVAWRLRDNEYRALVERELAGFAIETVNDVLEYQSRFEARLKELHANELCHD